MVKKAERTVKKAERTVKFDEMISETHLPSGFRDFLPEIHSVLKQG